MTIAVAVSAYSLYMTFHGIGAFPGKHERQRNPGLVLLLDSASNASGVGTIIGGDISE